MNNNKSIIRAAIGIAVAAAAFSSHAQIAGTWMFSGGVTRIAPNTSSGNLSPPAPSGTQVDIGADTQPTLAVGRMLTDNWSVEVPIGFGFKHDINGAGAISGERFRLFGALQLHVRPHDAIDQFLLLFLGGKGANQSEQNCDGQSRFHGANHARNGPHL